MRSVLLDLTHTSHTRARTGVQRVARALNAGLGNNCLAITHDPYSGEWRALEPWELENLESGGEPGHKRGAKWQLRSRLKGLLRRASEERAVVLRFPESALSGGLVVPEIFTASTGLALPPLVQAVCGPRGAIFHDAIALKLPEYTPAKTVARFPAYLAELLHFDGIAAVSDESRDSLIDYWKWMGETDLPEVTTIPLGVDWADALPEPAVAGRDARPVVLCVATVEGRKNHLSLLEACERLWAMGHDFELRLIGLANAESGAAALKRIEQLRGAGRPVHYEGAARESTLHSAFASCAFTVYPSLMEGFGLPVLESLAHGKPCICSSRGALGESTQGGGCVALPVMDPDSIARAIQRLLEKPAERADLAAEARARKFRSWATYATEVRSWLSNLRRRPARKG